MRIEFWGTIWTEQSRSWEGHVIYKMKTNGLWEVDGRKNKYGTKRRQEGLVRTGRKGRYARKRGVKKDMDDSFGRNAEWKTDVGEAFFIMVRRESTAT